MESPKINETTQRMISRVSPIYTDSDVGKWLFEVMGREIQDARNIYDDLRNQLFPETATWGLFYWERRYGIETDMTLDIETRRRNVIMKRGTWTWAPMNPARLEKIVSDMCDGRNVSLKENVAPYTFSISIDLAHDTNIIPFGAIKQRIDALKPSHQNYRLYFFSQAATAATSWIDCTVTTINKTVKIPVSVPIIPESSVWSTAINPITTQTAKNYKCEVKKNGI